MCGTGVLFEASTFKAFSSNPIWMLSTVAFSSKKRLITHNSSILLIHSAQKNIRYCVQISQDLADCLLNVMHFEVHCAEAQINQNN